MPTVLLVRHGHSSANGDGVLAGRMPGIHLTERGREQAARLAERFRELPVARVVSSPLERCLETAAPLAAAVGLEVTVDDELQECAYGAWTGRALKDLAGEDLWRTVQDDPETARFPDHERYAAESLREMSDRVVAAVRRHDEEVSAAAGDSAVWVAVTHGDLLKATLADATGSGLAKFQRFTADPASVSVVRYGSRHTFLLAANDTAPELARFQPPPQAPASGDAAVGGGAG
ncbi:Histidine phosphatase superfamily (branch 1) [Pedococcus dokdonensis]|uniref:Histidine phosphatase superfamily (Branch 1) n=1 Tax=Pedococcus dokdonensis TaxID=443156 RepID=A0A1H0NWB6_9MICO|nr:MSMEG_4193 family putative phosphomutase [Pedococcus dokdonensis]SDO97092.1 Histidine phosphatase superfamily (branch 1) [Pedococcus dokdonensis]